MTAMNGPQAFHPSLWYAALAIPILLAAIGGMVLILGRDIGRVRGSMAYADVPGRMDLDLKRNLHYILFVEQISDAATAAISPNAVASKVHCELLTRPYGARIPLIFVRVLMRRDQSKREIRAWGLKPV
jgi:hypothetical protein